MKDQGQEWRPRNRRLYVFSLPETQRIRGSILYKPQANRGFYSEYQEAWVISWAKDCSFPWQRGQKVYVTDGFELEPVNLDLWEQYQDLPEFASLRALAKDVEGTIRTEIIAEKSILATEEVAAG